MTNQNTNINDKSTIYLYPFLYDKTYQMQMIIQQQTSKEVLMKYIPYEKRKLLEETILGDFQSRNPIKLLCSFKKGSRCTMAIIRPEDTILPRSGEMISLSTLTVLLNVSLFSYMGISESLGRTQNTDAGQFVNSFLHELDFRLRPLKAEGKDGTLLNLGNHESSTFPSTTPILFLYGRIVKIDERLASHIKLYCETVSKTYTLCLSPAVWKTLREEILQPFRLRALLWFCGFVTVTEETFYNHSYGSAQEKKWQRYTIKHAALFSTNAYGLLTFNESELEFGNRVLSQGDGFIRLLCESKEAYDSGALLHIARSAKPAAIPPKGITSFTSDEVTIIIN